MSWYRIRLTELSLTTLAQALLPILMLSTVNALVRRSTWLYFGEHDDTCNNCLKINIPSLRASFSSSHAAGLIVQQQNLSAYLMVQEYLNPNQTGRLVYQFNVLNQQGGLHQHIGNLSLNTAEFQSTDNGWREVNMTEQLEGWVTHGTNDVIIQVKKYVNEILNPSFALNTQSEIVVAYHQEDTEHRHQRQTHRHKRSTNSVNCGLVDHPIRLQPTDITFISDPREYVIQVCSGSCAEPEEPFTLKLRGISTEERCCVSTEHRDFMAFRLSTNGITRPMNFGINSINCICKEH